MELHRRAKVMKCGADVENLALMFFKLREGGATNVEGALEIDVHDGSESVWG